LSGDLLSSPFTLLRPELVEGSLSKGKDWKGWSVRSCFDRLSTNGDQRIRIEKLSEEYGLERQSVRSYFDKLSTNGDRCCRWFGRLSTDGFLTPLPPMKK
jgi:hypothetical protein